MESVARVIVCDPSPVYRLGLESALRTCGFIVLDGNCETRAPDPVPETAVLSVENDQELSSLALLRARHSVPWVICLVTSTEPWRYRALLREGVRGIACRDAPIQSIIATVIAVHGGLLALPPDILPAMLESSPGPAGPGPPLTSAELAWLKALAEGATVAALARATGYSERAMFRLLARMYGHLGASGRSEALVAAARLGVV